jgi:uncharacterized protein YdhG (YjbR/CyaY superfamily)
MTIIAATPEEYLNQLPPDRKEAVSRLREVIAAHLPSGFTETMQYNMIAFVVPKDRYPAGYHCTPEEPLPFLNLASQKNFIAVYHMGLYADEQLTHWFTAEYARRSKTKLDMGKSCIRLKKMTDIPFDLFAELASKLTVEAWIALYEEKLKR